MLLLPQHVEQMMTARRVAALGAGLLADYEKPAPDYKRLLRRLLDEPGFTAAAQAVADRHRGRRPRRPGCATIADHLETLLAAPAVAEPRSVV